MGTSVALSSAPPTGSRAGFADPAEINGRVERLSRERAQMYAGRKRADFNAMRWRWSEVAR